MEEKIIQELHNISQLSRDAESYCNKDYIEQVETKINSIEYWIESIRRKLNKYKKEVGK